VHKQKAHKFSLLNRKEQKNDSPGHHPIQQPCTLEAHFRCIDENLASMAWQNRSEIQPDNGHPKDKPLSWTSPFDSKDKSRASDQRIDAPRADKQEECIVPLPNRKEPTSRRTNN
jgi:hypothetical protein